jgi:mannose-6-phosphate isomerase-like protein (cupin superfamily)
MAVRMIATQELDWNSVPDSWAGKAPKDKPGVRFKAFEVGAGSIPRAQVIEYEAGHDEPAHSHEEDEVFFFLDGQLAIGDQEAKPGTLVFIEGGTTYGPLRSDEGCRFLRLHLG